MRARSYRSTGTLRSANCATALSESYCQIYCQKRGGEGVPGDGELHVFQQLIDFYLPLRGFESRPFRHSLIPWTSSEGHGSQKNPRKTLISWHILQALRPSSAPYFCGKPVMSHWAQISSDQNYIAVGASRHP